MSTTLPVSHRAIPLLACGATGLLGGLAGSFAVSRLMEGFLFGIGARDALTFGSLPLFLAGVALAASYIPARRAAAVDPITALKCE